MTFYHLSGCLVWPDRLSLGFMDRLQPYHWLRQVLRELPAAKTVEAIEALLPWNVKAASSTKPMTETIVELESQV